MGSMSTATLLWSVLFGSVGAGYLLYGRKQRATIPLVCGLVLMVLPCLIFNAWGLCATGLLVMALPYFFRA